MAKKAKFYEIHYSYRDSKTGEESSDVLGYGHLKTIREAEGIIQDIRLDRIGSYTADFRENANIYILNQDYQLV